MSSPLSVEDLRKTHLYLWARESVLFEKMSQLNGQLKIVTDKKELRDLERQLAQSRWGYFPDGMEKEVEAVREWLRLESGLDVEDLSRWEIGQFDRAEPLGFFDKARLSNYFVLHPHKIAGKEQPTSSREFPLTIKGTQQGVIDHFSTYFKRPTLDLALIQQKAALVARNLKTMNLSFQSLSGIGLSGILSGYPKLVGALQKSEANLSSQEGKQSFHNVDRQYNQGIRREEKEAWVWYKRSLGIPMTGWENYFLSKKGVKTQRLRTLRPTMIRDNHFREIYTAAADKVLGMFTGKTHSWSSYDLLIFRDSEGVKMVERSDVEIFHSSVALASKEDLERLIRAGALFYLDGELLPYPIYAFANMYDRELQLREDKEEIINRYGQEVYELHLKIINEARPNKLSVLNPDIRERPKILAISDFARDFQVTAFSEEVGETLNIPDEQETISLRDAFEQWLESLPGPRFNGSSAREIIDYYLRGRQIRKMDKEAREQLKSDARNEGESLFGDFLARGIVFEDQQRLDLKWNRLFNGQSSIAYDRVPVGFEISSHFKQFNLELRPAQREGVAFMNAMGSGIIAYDVGVGKTMTAIVALADAIYSGKAKRPLIVVPNPTYKKWMEELIGYEVKTGKGKKKKTKFVPGILSYTGIKVNDWFNLGTKVLKRIKLDREVPEKSITLITYEGFKKIGFSPQVEDEMVTELSNALGQSGNEDLSARQEQIDYSKYEEIIGVGQRGTIANIDTIGFDYLVIDEAHRCKNIFSGVKGRSETEGSRSIRRFGMSGAVSQTGIKAFFLCNYIQRRYGRNVCLLTATPFTNSPLEIYSMLSLVAYNQFKAMNIVDINTFFQLFVLEQTEHVVNVKGEVTAKDVVKRFNNRRVLQTLIHNHIIHKSGEEAGIVRPCKINLPRINVSEEGRVKRLPPKDQVLSFLHMTPEQKTNQAAIIKDMEKATKRKKIRKGMLFRAMAASLDNALSPFLVKDFYEPDDYEEFIYGSPKLHYVCECIRSVRDWHLSRGQEVSGQVIYMNRGKDFFPLLKEFLEKEVGYETGKKFGRSTLDEVEIVSGDVSPGRRETIKDAFNEGTVKVIIGTSTIREGVDLQRQSTVLYNCYPDWNPTDIRQLEGRIWRQGNKFGYVRVVMPLVENTMDVFVFQKLEEKTARINDIWYRGDRGNVLDLESMDPEEIKFALLSDMEQLARFQIEKEHKIQEKRIERFKYDLDILKEFSERYSSYLSLQRTLLNKLDNLFQNLKYSPLIEPTRANLKERNEKDTKVIKQRWKLFKGLEKFHEKSSTTDKEILALGNALQKLIFALGKTDYPEKSFFIEFRTLVKTVRLAESTILSKRGMTVNEVEDAQSQLEQDLTAAQEELTRIKSTTHFYEVVEEVRKKKEELAISGESVPARAKEFSKLNHLLGFLQGDSEGNTCAIPQPEQAIKMDRLKLIQIQAKALSISLALRNRRKAS